MSERGCIVIGWTERREVLDQYLRLSHVHVEARAVVWSNDGDSCDVKRAESMFPSPQFTVLVLPLDEPDPLERARKEVAGVR